MGKKLTDFVKRNWYIIPPLVVFGVLGLSEIGESIYKECVGKNVGVLDYAQGICELGFSGTGIALLYGTHKVSTQQKQ